MPDIRVTKISKNNGGGEVIDSIVMAEGLPNGANGMIVLTAPTLPNRSHIVVYGFFKEVPKSVNLEIKGTGLDPRVENVAELTRRGSRAELKHVPRVIYFQGSLEDAKTLVEETAAYVSGREKLPGYPFLVGKLEEQLVPGKWRDATPGLGQSGNSRQI